MTSPVIGTGLILLITIWIIAIIVSVISLRTERIIGVVTIVSAVIITIVVSLLPVQIEGDIRIDHKEYDYTFMWRCILATFLGLCSLGSIAVFITQHCAKPIHAVPVNSWILDK